MNIKISFYDFIKRDLLLFCIIIPFLAVSCTQNTSERVKELIKSDKCQMAIAEMDKEIKNEPDSIRAVTELCLAEGSKFLENGNYQSANILCKYAVKTCKTYSYSLPDNISIYLSKINNRDSLFSLIEFIIKTIPTSYQYLAIILTQLNSSFENAITGNLQLISNGYSSETWLFPSNSSPEINRRLFGLSTFNPITSERLTSLEISQITSMNTETLYQSIENDQFFYAPNICVDLHFSSIPELRNDFVELKKKDKYQIATEKDYIVRKIVDLREKYLISNLEYIFTKFEIVGKCYAFKQDYNYDNQQADIHLYVDDLRNGVYVATIRVPLSLEEATKFFTNEVVEGKFIFKVSPGFGRKGLGIGGGGVSAWNMPNLFLKEAPIIIFTNNSTKLKFQFTTDELNGDVWPSSLNTKRWDLNYDWRRDHGQKPYGDNVRLVFGKRS